MSKRRKKPRQTRKARRPSRIRAPEETTARKKQQPVIPIFEYYNRPFQLFHAHLQRTHQLNNAPHPIRERFWQVAALRKYDLWEARSLLKSYLNQVESELKSMLSRWSIAYWLHAYRRLYPGAIGWDRSPHTIGLTRAAMEAAIQKYGAGAKCSRVGISSDVPLKKVLNGILLSPDFEFERVNLKQAKAQLVLTDFGPAELKELYEVEKLAFEIWRSSATLRSIGKGATFVVEERPHFFQDDRSDDLDWLLQHFDNRNMPIGISTFGVVFKNGIHKPHEGTIFLPAYNLTDIRGEHYAPIFRHFSDGKINIDPSTMFNFVWYPFSIGAYRDAHSPLNSAFKRKHGVTLDAVLLIVASLCSRVFYSWTETKGENLIRFFQRAYEGPYERRYVLNEVLAFKSFGAMLLGISVDAISDAEFNRAFRFWTLTPSRRREIDLAYSGRHHIFLPFGKDRLFIDYAWIDRRLYDLFVGVRIPDQRFKGDVLEEMVRQKPSDLPTAPCKARDGTMKQIDASYVVGKHLVLIECKAVSHSIGFDRGDPEAINFRREHVIERLLNEADSKANWLAKRPNGRNYNLEGILDILPVGVSPFVEFIPSREFR